VPGGVGIRPSRSSSPSASTAASGGGVTKPRSLRCSNSSASYTRRSTRCRPKTRNSRPRSPLPRRSSLRRRLPHRPRLPPIRRRSRLAARRRPRLLPHHSHKPRRPMNWPHPRRGAATLVPAAKSCRGRGRNIGVRFNETRITRRPRWLVAAIKGGKKLDDFLIDKSARKGRKKRRSKR
jgi:hypothetical protein